MQQDTQCAQQEKGAVNCLAFSASQALRSPVLPLLASLLHSQLAEEKSRSPSTTTPTFSRCIYVIAWLCIFKYIKPSQDVHMRAFRKVTESYLVNEWHQLFLSARSTFSEFNSEKYRFIRFLKVQTARVCSSLQLEFHTTPRGPLAKL